MQLNINSKTAQLYRWFYSTAKMPQSLCPYFWKLAVMWLAILPYVILSIPVIAKERLDPSETHKTGERIGISLMIYFILFMLISMITALGIFFVMPAKDSAYFNMVIAGCLGWVVSIVIGSIEFSKWVKVKWENRHVRYDEDGYRIWEPVKEKEPNIIKEFVKAKYNKYCPKIDWKH